MDGEAIEVEVFDLFGCEKVLVDGDSVFAANSGRIASFDDLLEVVHYLVGSGSCSAQVGFGCCDTAVVVVGHDLAWP